MPTVPLRRSSCALLPALAILLGLPLAAAAPASAQPARPGAAAGEGTIVGQVFDAETGVPVEGVMVALLRPAAAPGGEPRREVQVTNRDGAYVFEAVPSGTYDLGFTRSGYRASSLERFAVLPGEVNRADFPLPPLPKEPGSEVLELEEFVVVGSPVDMESLELRIDSDQLLNVLSAEEFSKFAATDVAEGIQRLAGVNVVEGQFAIIRGLEDRYSSTLYNSAPIPSPDPNRQSVQLDLFPSEVVNNLAVSKTFGPELPSNSSGGSIDIITHDYPEELEIGVKAAGGFNDNALDRFLEFEPGSPMGSENDDDFVPVDVELGASVGGRQELAERELRYKAVLNWERGYDTAEGFQEGREPRPSQTRLFPRPPTVTRSGDLSLGQLNLTAGRFDLTESTQTDQGIGYLGLGLDLDAEGRHRLDASVLYTSKDEEVVELKENGYLPNFDYGVLAAKQTNGQEIDPNADFDGFATLTAWIARSVRGSNNDAPSRGPLWYASFFESKSFERDRDLLVTQVNGDHRIEQVEGLHVRWAANWARTTQQEESRGARFFFEPADTSQIPTAFPTTPEALGMGQFAVNEGIFLSDNDIEESQGFGRLDADYQTDLSETVTLEVRSGGWYEHASRDVDSSFLEGPTVAGLSQFAILADTPEGLGEAIFQQLDRNLNGELAGLRNTANEATREIQAGHFGLKAVLWEDLDLLGGLRFESVFIDSRNDAFTGELALDGTPAIFPTKYLFFDRLDNPARNEVSAPPPPGTTFNDQLLGIEVPVDPATGLVDLVDRAAIESIVNGEIDETLLLPAVGIAYRPLEGLSLRGAWSRTTARPSFREMGFYVSVEPGTDDLIVGNPQLMLSDVESWDARGEYAWGELGDLAAVSLFYKTIDDPIESIVVRNPLNAEGSSSALYRTFFNNPNQATLWGVEVEARKHLDFLGSDLLEHLSLGANFTWIEAKVDRIEAELDRSRPFFGTARGDVELFSGLESSRRLFGQPQWIANADVSFDHEDWGTQATLAFFAISDVLDAAGSAVIAPNGQIISFTPDRYVDSFHQLDLIVSQKVHVELLRGDVTFKLSAKNLTDSTRRIIYDPSQTDGEIPERSYKVGREYKLTVSYAF
jgi:TonB-dependent receptor